MVRFFQTAAPKQNNNKRILFSNAESETGAQKQRTVEMKYKKIQIDFCLFFLVLGRKSIAIKTAYTESISGRVNEMGRTWKKEEQNDDLAFFTLH